MESWSLTNAQDQRELVFDSKQTKKIHKKEWTESEIERKRLVESGLAVVADCHKGGNDARLVTWTQETNRFVYVGRRNWHYPASIWGNPTIRRKDDTKADRERVCEAFARHLEADPDLIGWREYQS